MHENAQIPRALELPNRNDTNSRALRVEDEEFIKSGTLSLSTMSKEVSFDLETLTFCVVEVWPKLSEGNFKLCLP